MVFWSLLEVSSMPILQVLLVGGLGAYMATDYSGLLPADVRRVCNKIVFVIFTPALIFANLAKTVTLEDIISWWFMPVNVGLTFFIGGILGWIMVKLMKPEPYLEGLVIALCSSANLGNLVVILVPAMCNQEGSPFGDAVLCRPLALSYASFSMALGGFYIWTYSYQLVRISAMKHDALQESNRTDKKSKADLDGSSKTPLLKAENEDSSITESDTEAQYTSVDSKKEDETLLSKVVELFHQFLEELTAPPTIAAILGLIFGAVKWLKWLIIGEDAPLHVIQDSIQLLGDGAIPCVTLILGGNLTQGLQDAKVKLSVIVGFLVVKFILLPVIGVGVVLVADYLGFLPADPLYRFVLLLQYALPPAVNISTMTQLFHVGQEECSVMFLWAYLFAVFALTLWSIFFLSILS
ncbi:Protein PIN-LIKES 7 [Dionaea muscipula]